MKYLCTIYADESRYASMSEQEGAGADGGLRAVRARGRGGRRARRRRGAAADATATTLRVRDGERMLTDGPFAETREQLGGYYLLDCRDLDEAIGWAAKIPDATHGSIEVRPIMDYEAMGGEAAPQHDSAARG